MKSNNYELSHVTRSLVGGWPLLLLMVALGVAVGFSLIYILPKKYESTTVLLPPQPKNGAMSAALSQLGAITGMGSSGLGQKTPDELYVGLLRSASVVKPLIKKYQLTKAYGVSTESDAAKTLSERSRIVADKKSGLISISVIDEDKSVAKNIANSYYAELVVLLKRLAITDAQQRRAFLSEQVTSAKLALDKAEQQFKDTKRKSGLVFTGVLAEGGVRQAQILKSELISKQIEMKVLERFATPANPTRIKLAAELDELQTKIRGLEAGGEQVDAVDGNEGAASFREYKTRELAYESLVKQLEIAKVDEADDGVMVQQVDAAEEGEVPVAPRKLLLMLLSVIASTTIGAGYLIVKGYRRP
jgi:tyrosine-protein kinase Etk/Wzc